MVQKKQWIWEDENYPNFEYDIEKITPIMLSIARKQGELLALSQVMGNHNLQKTQSKALENEILASSAIEGELLDRDSVKSSIKEKLGIESVQHYKQKSKESHYVDILLDANRSCKEPLTLNKIFSWHLAMFEKQHKTLWGIEVGDFRQKGTMQIVSGVVGKEKVFYEAPPSTSLHNEMKVFLEWFNATPPSLIKAGIAHLWFVIIHPFDDGNGRITRAITDSVLSSIEDANTIRLYSMSKSINSNRKGYYKALELTTGYIQKSKQMDITDWLEWFMNTLEKSLDDALLSIKYILQKTAFWDIHKDKPLNSRQRLVLNTILDQSTGALEVSLSTKKYLNIAKTTSATASRDIKSLVSLGCIRQVEGTGGRNIRYELVLN